MAKKKALHHAPPARPDSGPLAFDAWYGAMHAGRWPDLSRACSAPNRHFELSAGLLKPYYLDPASVLAALCLDIEPGQTVLDLCAAPGGKTLVIAQRLFGLVPAAARLADLGRFGESPSASAQAKTDSLEAIAEYIEVGDRLAEAKNDIAEVKTNFGSQLVANERSAARRGRLRQVLSQHLPANIQDAIKTPGFDASTWGQHQINSYDRILLDVPCSSERHLIQDPSYLEEWSPKRSQQLAQQAYAMGLSAGRALKPGGRLLYCTCALSELENDDAVGRIIRRSEQQAARFGYRLEALPPDALPASAHVDLAGLAESTRFGLRFWPDRSDGLGPLYFSLMQKVGS